MHPRSLLLALSCFLLLAGTAAAQSPIRMGQTVSGRLDASDPRLPDRSHYELWSYRGSRGETISATLRSSDFDAFLAVGRMSSGTFDEIESDDDAAGGTDARVVVTLPADGEYVIRANTLAGGQTGAYTLALATGVAQEQTTPRRTTDGLDLHPSPGRIRAGQRVSGALAEGDPVTFDGTLYDDWIYTGRAGERLAITQRSGAFDSYLQFGRVEDGKFSYIGAEDDGAGGNDSLYEVTLPADGEYVIRVNTLFEGRGPYTVEVQRK